MRVKQSCIYKSEHYGLLNSYKCEFIIVYFCEMELNVDLFNKRLLKIFEYHSLTSTSFSNKIGVPRSTISHILSERNKPSLDFIIKTVNAFETIEINWLLFGIGEFPNKRLINSKNSNISSSEPSQRDLFSSPENLATELDETSLIAPKEKNKLKENGVTVKKVILLYSNNTFKIFENN